MGNFNYITIKNFRGINKSRDVLSAIPGQLSKNENYLYETNGGLAERGGGAKLTENPSGGDDPIFSLANYTSPDGSNFLVTNQDTTAYYYDSGWNDLSLTLTADKRTVWEGAGFEAGRSLYGANGNDSIIKVTGNTPAGSSVTGSPTDATYLKLHKNRLFAINNRDTLYFTEALAFDTWNTSVNTIEIAPGIDGNIQSLEVWGDALFIFKEYGVYVLPNASDPVPTVNWVILRTDAASGTQSPYTVKRTRIGIFYLSTDNSIRLLGPNVTFSSGEYSLGESGSPIVSEDIADDLNEFVDLSNRDEAYAITFKDKYILSFDSNTSSTVANDLTYFADVTKFNKHQNIPQPQPYWGEFTGFDYNFFAIQTSGTQEKLYGAKGVEGEVHETLNDSVNNDDSSAIVSKSILAWHPIDGEGTYKRINQIYFSGDTENWNINLIFNAYKLGTDLPTEGAGREFSYMTSNISGGIVGTGQAGTAQVGFVGPSSATYSLNVSGHYFGAEFGNSSANEFTRVLKMIVYYRVIKQR